MSRFNSPLDRVRVAAPCPADWDRMVGDERVRFCQTCELNVYNLSGMSRREAEALVAGAEGRLCVRFYRRADGSVLTRNCPAGLRAIKWRISRVSNAVAAAALGFFAGLGLAPARSTTCVVELQPESPGAVAPAPAAADPAPLPLMGGMMLPEEPREGWTRGRMGVAPVMGKTKPGVREARRVGREK